MTDIIAIGVIVVILALVIFYIYRSKRNGVKCIGCPMAKECSAGKCKCNK